MKMRCQRCKGERILAVSSKCSDLCTLEYRDLKNDGHVPQNLNLMDEYCDYDYVTFHLCLDCGQYQGKFPIPEETVREAFRITMDLDPDEVKVIEKMRKAKA